MKIKEKYIYFSYTNIIPKKKKLNDIKTKNKFLSFQRVNMDSFGQLRVQQNDLPA